MYSREEKQQVIKNFWHGFNLYCSRLPFLKGKRKKWLLHRTKVANVHLKFEPGRSNVKVILEIQHKSESSRLEMFEKIENYRTILEEGFDGGLIWDFVYTRDTGKEVCRIYCKKEGLDIHRQAQWGEMYEFMAENMHRLENNFLEIRDLIKYS